MKRQYSFIFISIFIIIILTSCNKKNRYEIDITAAYKVSTTYHRYDIDLINIDTNNFVNGLINLSNEYSIFLDDVANDTIGVYKIKDFICNPSTIALVDECHKIYPDKYTNKEFDVALSHLKYYMPELVTPEVYTYISGLDYDYPAVYNRNSLIVALDMYLGSKYDKIYLGIGMPMYRIRRCNSKYMVRDCMFQIADSCNIDESECTKLIDWMIYYGKNLEFTKRMLPDIADTVLFGYTESQLKWCEKNEEEIWKYIVSGNILYTTDILSIHKMIDDGPFTSFLSHESPSEIGRWVGWQIVSSYMKNNNTKLSDLMKETNSQNILSKSHYRP